MLQTKDAKGVKGPGAISHHTSVVWNNKMYLYGGSKANSEENLDLFVLDVDKCLWNIVKTDKS